MPIVTLIWPGHADFRRDNNTVNLQQEDHPCFGESTLFGAKNTCFNMVW